MISLIGSGKRSGFQHALVAFALVCSAFAESPTIVDQPRPLSVGPGDRAGFVVTASGAAPLSYQWYRGTTLIAGATADYLLLPSAQPSDAGDYTVRVSNADGTVTSAPAKLTIAAYAKDWFDLTYQGQGRPLLILPDGGTLSTGYGDSPSLVRTKPDGTVDPTFAYTPPSSGGPTAWPQIELVARQDDSHFYAVSSTRFAVHGGGEAVAYALRRLNSSGAIDPAFTPSLDETAQTIQFPEDSKAMLARRILLPVGDKIVVAKERTLVRLNRDGSVDSTFKLILPATVPANFVVTAAALDRAGNILVGGTGYLWRAKSDGSQDTGFSLSANLETVTEILPTPEGGCWAGTIAPDEPSFESELVYRVRRFSSIGQVDPAVNGFSLSTPYPPELSLQADGRVVIAGFFEIRRTIGETGRQEIHRGVLRLLSDGSIDPTFFSIFPARTSWPRWWMLPDGTHALSGGFKLNLSTLGPIEPPRILHIETSAETIAAGDDLTIHCIAVGPSLLNIRANSKWANPGESQIVLRNMQSEDVVVTAVGRGGEATQRVKIKLTPSAPRFNQPLAPVIARRGQRALLNATVRGSEPITYQWLKDGVVLDGVQSNSGDGRVSYSVGPVAEASAGTYTVRATNLWGTAECSTTLTVTQTSQLTNLSVRANAGVGDDVMIVGLVLQNPKKLLFQAIGPELVNHGVGGVLGDPTATLHMADGAEVVNDDGGWFNLGEVDPYYQETGAWILYGLVTKSSEFRLESLDGVNTIVVAGKNGSSGVALAQIFDADGSTNRMMNLSARVFAGTGDSTAITGFTIKGDAPHRVLIRCVGPGLSGAGVGNLLSDPSLSLVDQKTHETIHTNDNWGTGTPTEVAALRSTMQTVGAFPLAEGSKDAALLVTLQPGEYTAIVSGANGATGVVLLEVYDAP